MKFSLRHQSSGKIYPYMVQTGHLMMRGLFRKIYIHNRKGVPTDKPVLLAANHPTAFVDPCVLCTFLEPPLYNMTRGDIFRKRFFRMFMEGINMFPVFRAKDGYAGRDRNDEVFEFCRQNLSKNRVVTIYVEGEHHLDRCVKPVQKGIMRIAFGTYEKYRLEELQIIPASCNYTYGDRPRDEVILNIGAPIFVRDYWEEYQADPAGAINRLGADIREALKKVTLHLDDLADAPLAEQLLQLDRAEHAGSLFPVVEFGHQRFVSEKAICDHLNAASPATKQALVSNTSRFFAALQSAGLDAGALLHPEWGRWSRLPLFLLGFLPFLIGYLTSLPVIEVARYVTRKVVKKREFLSSVHLGVAYFFAILLYYPALLLAGVLSHNPWWIALALSLPALGWFSMFFRENWARWSGARRALRHPERDNLLALRQKIDL